ncbi:MULTISPECIES: GFA family protein [unclassified Roseofilum]|uniref:GFA family protein n=1 Tax=unclassified Roseofilum TaxID=2620099 RepID=UPI000E841AFD|nr:MULTISPECIES: GFA family protein [unclassified Roseofilum]MBP0011013.1 GFA family protein [Roseofilum sp. Belize Diploria]MBP0036010.1 GFA family protein [Roseofilum sp. Belize BBD 4]HBQ97472.1 aldehyde-activating protein [Cyanobacteria bacterium UBA11691]
MKATGHCQCGAVTYSAEGMETDVHTCHCNICVRWTGGPAFAVSVGQVTFEGEENISRFDSSEWAERGFCSRCGTHLFYRLKEADQYMLWMGTFDDSTQFKLAGEIFIDQKPHFYDLAGDHPRLTGEEFMDSILNN